MKLEAGARTNGRLRVTVNELLLGWAIATHFEPCEQSAELATATRSGLSDKTAHVTLKRIHKRTCALERNYHVVRTGT